MKTFAEKWAKFNRVSYEYQKALDARIKAIDSHQEATAALNKALAAYQEATAALDKARAALNAD